MATFTKVQVSDVKALVTTSDKIRYILAAGFTPVQTKDIINQLGVTTRAGGPISYQFVNNVMHSEAPKAKKATKVKIEL